MKFRGLMAVTCAAAFTVACAGDRDDTRSVTETEQPQTADDRVGTTAAGVSGDAREFIEQVANSSMAEIRLGQLASERAQSAEVKQFGQMMVRDHSKASDELKQLVSPYNVTMPTELDAEHNDLMEKLRNLRGAEFDREYMSAMVDGHREMQDLLEGRAENGRNQPQSHGQIDPTGTTGRQEGVEAALNQWALKTKPSVDKHLETAQQIQDKLQGSTRNNTN